MHFGYDSVLGEVHDTTVRCLTDAEVLAVPREQLQKAVGHDTYLQSVWQAPAKRSILLRRELSQALSQALSRGQEDAMAPTSGETKGLAGSTGSRALRADRLKAEDFEPLLRRSRPCRLVQGEVVFEQGSVPSAVYLLREGECQVETTTGAGNYTTVVGKLTAGDHFGEGALLEGRDRRNSAVRCIDPNGCQLGVLSKGAFSAILRAQPELATAFESITASRNRKRLRSIIALAVERSECETRTLKTGQVLFSQGDTATDFFMVESGAVQIAYRTSDGRQLPSRTHRAGDIFGASGLVAGDRKRRDIAIAIEPTVVKAIPHSRFNALMRQDSLLAEGLRRSTTFSDLNGGESSAATDHSAHAEPVQKGRGRSVRELAVAWSGHVLVGKDASRDNKNKEAGGQQRP
jgi:CRP-like cAMP-binding protein